MGKKKTVIAVNISTGEKTAYSSIRKAATAVGAEYTCVSRVLKKRHYKSCKGYTFIYEGDEVPDLTKITGKKGRPKSGETQQNATPETKIKRYYFTNERGVYTEKVARWNKKNHVLSISYNFMTSMLGDICPNLEYMEDIVRGKMKVRGKKFIYVLDGRVSRKEKNAYFINAQMYFICDVFPSENELRRIERWITDVRYYDDEGKNDFNKKRLGQFKKSDDKHFVDRKRALILKNNETDEEIRYECCSEAAEEFGVSESTVAVWCREKKEKNGYQWRYAY